MPAYWLDIDFDFFYWEPVEQQWDLRECTNSPAIDRLIWIERALLLQRQGREITAGFASDPHLTPERLTGLIQKQIQRHQTIWWNRYREKSPPIPLHLMNSHVRAYRPIEESLWHYEWLRVFHLDAHHDVGYAKARDLQLTLEKLDAGNWLWHLMKHYPHLRATLVYPYWRTHDPEPRPRTGVSRQLTYQTEDAVPMLWTHSPYASDFRLPDGLIEGITLCLSSAWVPEMCWHRYWKMVDSLKAIEGIELVVEDNVTAYRTEPTTHLLAELEQGKKTLHQVAELLLGQALPQWKPAMGRTNNHGRVFR